MIRRLAAAGLAILVLSACDGGSNPPATPAPAGQAATTDAPRYKATSSKVLSAVRKRGYVACGVNPGLPGFAYPDFRGAWRGFDVDFCRAVAAAVLGDANKVRFTPIASPNRFSALQRGEIDILSRNTSWSFSRDAGLGLDFTATTYFDGQGFLAPKALGLTSAQELSGARICVQAGAASLDNLADYFRARGLSYKPVVVASEAEARRRYENDGCDVFTADISALAGSRSVLNNPGAHVILPDVISKEPLGPVVRNTDLQWCQVVKWVSNALLDAEYLAVTPANVDDMLKSGDSSIQRLLGVGDNDFGKSIGLDAKWAYNIVKALGNYGEIYDRHLGPNTPMGLARGVNAQWNQGGIQYGMPIL